MSGSSAHRRYQRCTIPRLRLVVQPVGYPQNSTGSTITSTAWRYALQHPRLRPLRGGFDSKGGLSGIAGPLRVAHRRCTTSNPPQGCPEPLFLSGPVDLSTPVKATTSEPHGLIRKRPRKNGRRFTTPSFLRSYEVASHRLEVEGSFGTEGSDLPSSIGC